MAKGRVLAMHLTFRTCLFAAAFAAGVVFCSQGGPKASATWAGSVEFRNRSQAAATNATTIDTRLPPGMVIIFR